MPSRRHVLATLGGALTAGCTTRDPETSPTTQRTTTTPATSTSTTRSTTTTTSTTAEPTEFAGITATRSFVARFAGAHAKAYTSPDTTFVLARAADRVDPDGFVLSLGDRERSPVEELGGHDPSAIMVGAPEGDGVLLAFAVEGVVAPADPTIRGPVGTTPLPEAARNYLRQPPSLSLVGFQAPDEAPAGSEIPVSLTVRNTGDAPGVFRANLGSDVLSGRPVAAIEVPAQTTQTVERTVPLYGDGDAETVVCRWGTGSDALTVTLTD